MIKLLNHKAVFLKGIENLKIIGKPEQLSLKASVKFFAFYCYLCFISKKRNISSNVFIINGYPEAKRNDPTEKRFKRVYLRKFSNNYKELKDFTSLPSLLEKKDRIKVLFRAFTSLPHGGHFLGRWFEFLLLTEVFKRGKIKRLCSFGHYDELSFWLTELCKYYKIYYVMYQHGIVLSDIHIPNKLFCNEIHLYNYFSKSVFENSVIKNKNCVYKIDGFVSNISFKKLEKDDKKKYIGIVDQTFPSWLNNVTNIVTKISGCVAVVLLHPLTDNNVYENRDNIIVTRDKYDNLDAIISDFSTLILDYISIGYTKKIICTNESVCENVFAEYGLRYISEEKLYEELPKFLLEE